MIAMPMVMVTSVGGMPNEASAVLRAGCAVACC